MLKKVLVRHLETLLVNDELVISDGLKLLIPQFQEYLDLA